MRVWLALPVALLISACGSSVSSPSQTGGSVSPPETGAPASARVGPPAAWIETKAGSRWLGFSSWCWTEGQTGGCLDAVAPACSRPDVPNILVQSGETVRAHLGYTPTEASVEGADAQLEGRTVSWRVEQRGPFTLFTRGEGSRDATYVGCAVIR